MSFSLRAYRAAALAIVALLTLAPSMANANAKGMGVLIEYAGTSHMPPPPELFGRELLNVIGSGL
jgi:hypothetical protein